MNSFARLNRNTGPNDRGNAAALAMTLHISPCATYAEQGEDTAGPEFSEFHIELNRLSGEQEEQVQA